MQPKYCEGSSVNKGQCIVNQRKLCQPGECVASNLICCWQNRDRCSSQTNPYTHARHRSSIKVDWFKALKDCSSAIPGLALPLLLPWYQIAVIQDGLHWKAKGMFSVCPANAGNILSHRVRGDISGNDGWTLSGWFVIWSIRYTKKYILGLFDQSFLLHQDGWDRRRFDGSKCWCPGCLLSELARPSQILVTCKKSTTYKPVFTLIQCYYQTHSIRSQMPNKGFTGRGQTFALLWLVDKPAVVSPVIHSPVHGKHPLSDLQGEGAHLVSSINKQLFNNGFQEKEKGTTGHISQ